MLAADQIICDWHIVDKYPGKRKIEPETASNQPKYASRVLKKLHTMLYWHARDNETSDCYPTSYYFVTRYRKIGRLFNSLHSSWV